jgi:AcrR family transcriptional regulator
MPRSRRDGNLREELIAAAIAEIAEVGPAAASLRQVAARAGVTHPAVAHHFGDKTGLLTAVAVAGQRQLNAALAHAQEGARSGGDLLAMGVAYLRFAHDHRAEFEVMHRRELLDDDDPDLLAARAAGREHLGAGASQLAGTAAAQEVALAAWSLVHGFASLWLAGALPVRDPDDLEGAERLFRRLARRTFTPPKVQ